MATMRPTRCATSTPRAARAGRPATRRRDGAEPRRPAAGPRRPTPARAPRSRPAFPGAKRIIPPELGAGAIAVLEGRAFCYSDPRGDVPPGSIGGFVRADTRFLSTWVLTIDGEPLPILRSDAVDYYSAVFFLTNPATRRPPEERHVGPAEPVRRRRPPRGDQHPQLLGRTRCGSSSGWPPGATSPTCSRSRRRSGTAAPRSRRNHDPAAGRARRSGTRTRRSRREARMQATGDPAIDGDDLVWQVELAAARRRGRPPSRSMVDASGLLLEHVHRDFGDSWQRGGRLAVAVDAAGAGVRIRARTR